MFVFLNAKRSIGNPKDNNEEETVLDESKSHCTITMHATMRLDPNLFFYVKKWNLFVNAANFNIEAKPADR